MHSKTINFSTNWNNKLDCKCFTTLRLKNPKKYRVGAEYLITQNRKPKKKALIEAIRTIYFKEINEFVAHLDTGYSAHETQNILRKMYGRKVNLDTQPFSFILLKTVS